jgi:N utilization substance protein B
VTLRDRRKGRELALQALYQLEITRDESERALSELFSGDATPAARRFASELVRGVLTSRARIDELIEKACEHWRLERLSRIDLSVIRVAAYELMTPPALPLEIAINEAVEIARRFGTKESSAFVNGVLDQVAAKLGLKAAGEVKRAAEPD